MYDSKTIQTLFNKFIKRGKKAKSLRYITRAFVALRCSVFHPRVDIALNRILQMLRIQFILVVVRRGRDFLDVPVPIRRNQRDIINLQTFYTAVKIRRERALHERLEQELLSLMIQKDGSPTMRKLSATRGRVYEERVWFDKRFK